MPKVFIPTLLRHLSDGRTELDIDGATVRQIIANLEAQYPGIEARLLEGGRLRPNIAIAINGEISPLGLHESISPTSELHFLTAIRGG